MRVALLVVAVGDDHLRALAADDRDQPADGLVEVGAWRSSAGSAFASRVGHARVAVAEHDDLVVADDLGRARELLACAPRAGRSRTSGRSIAGLRMSPASPPVQHTSTRAHALVVVPGDRAGALRRLVVGVGVHGQEAQLVHAPHASQTECMKVAFVGSLSTGKTTLANLFAREWDYPLLPEVAREVVELGFPLDQSATAETETLIFLKQWRAELLHEDYVADRSIYDVLAYADWVMENAEPSARRTTCGSSRGRWRPRDLRARYDFVFYLPIEFPIVLDGLRPDDTGFQADIDRRIRGLLELHDVAHHTLSGSVEERQEQVRKVVAAAA